MSTAAGITFLHRVENAPRVLRAVGRILLRPKRELWTTVDLGGLGRVRMPYRRDRDERGRRADVLGEGKSLFFGAVLPCRTASHPKAAGHPFFDYGDRGMWEARRGRSGVYTLLETFVTVVRGREYLSVTFSQENDRAFALFRFPAASRLTWAMRRGGGDLAFCWSWGDVCDPVSFEPVELGRYLPPPLSAAESRRLALMGERPESVPDDFDAEGERIDLGEKWWEEEDDPDALARRLRAALAESAGERPGAPDPR